MDVNEKISEEITFYCRTNNQEKIEIDEITARKLDGEYCTQYIQRYVIKKAEAFNKFVYQQFTTTELLTMKNIINTELKERGAE